MSIASPETTLGQQAGMAMQSWRDRLYFAVGEQFTYFNTVQMDGQEVPNETDQYLASSITQLVAGYAFNSRFALQLNVPLIYRSFQRPEGFAIDRGTVSGLGDVSLLLQSVLFHYTSAPRREMHFEPGNKSPVVINHEPDFTASVVLFTGVKFPTGATERLKEEFNEKSKFRARQRAEFTAMISRSAPVRMMEFSGVRARCVTRASFSRPMCNSRCAAMVRTNIILPTISRGVGDPATTSFAMHTRSLVCNLWYPANTRMWTGFAERKQRILASRPSQWGHGLSLR